MDVLLLLRANHGSRSKRRQRSGRGATRRGRPRGDVSGRSVVSAEPVLGAAC
jgi:hypothetical protein